MKTISLFAGIVGLFLFCGISFDANAQSNKLQLAASRLKQIAIDKNGFLINIGRSDVTNVTPSQTICYQKNIGEYQIRLVKTHPYFKEIVAFMLAAYLNKKPFALVATGTGPVCDMESFVLQ